MDRSPSIAFLLLAGTAMSGCVAAAVPALIGGVAARRLVHGARAHPEQGARAHPNQPGRRDLAETAAAPADPVPASAVPSLAYPPVPEMTGVLAGKPGATLATSPAPVIELLPTDLRLAEEGHVYRGSLPPPGTAAGPVTDSMPAPATRIAGAPTRPALTGWSALGHYVVGHLAERSSVLLARGSGAIASPSPPCSGLPLAVLAPATLVEAATRRAADRSWLDALHTLNVTLVLTGTSPAAEAAVAKAGLPAPVVGDTLLVATTPADMPAIRAKVAARYCVIAVAGGNAADFPNNYLPGTTPAAYRDRWGAGWFFFPQR